MKLLEITIHVNQQHSICLGSNGQNNNQELNSSYLINVLKILFNKNAERTKF